MNTGWFHRTIIETGRLPLFCFFAGMVAGFLFIRLSVRLIRAEVKWWPGNVKPGGLHIHHVVFGVVFMLLGGVAGLSIPSEFTGWNAAAATVFGVGSALVLDEFALILHLNDVYWEEQGRTSIDAVFVAIAVTGMLLLGLRPAGLDDFVVEGPGAAPRIIMTLIVMFHLALAVIVLLKGKIWTGLIGLFLIPILYIGAIRLARPDSPWARWRYHRYGSKPATKLRKAQWRENRLRRPLIRAKIWFQELLAGRHDKLPD